MTAPRKLRIGDVLLEENLITKEQLDEVIEQQELHGGKLSDLFVQAGLVSETEILRALSNQLEMPFIELENYTIKEELARKLPERIARRFRVVILDFIAGSYLIGMADPTDVLGYDEVNRILDKELRIAIVKESFLLKILDQVYRRTDDITSFANELKAEIVKDEEDSDEKEDLLTDSAPVAKLLDSIFEDAVQIGSSDIHIEPDENLLRIRQRVDGVLQESILEGNKINRALVLRIKLIAKMNISEKRLPQDGRFRIKVKNKVLDVRVSTMPVTFGESVVMRILDQSKGLLNINDIQMDEYMLSRLKYFITRPNGIIVVTGPTGSGKTTTLYAILNELNSNERKIITIEDPVEYTLPMINQVQINSSIGLTFASVLRTALRQDPEIIMVGEMRDEETARIGLRSALTGHLVLSTLHTNDAISSAMRLLDMGIEGYLVAAALKMILAQRLIRKICPLCADLAEPTDFEKELLTKLKGKIDPNWKFKRGRGCSSCGMKGYSGRVGIYEMVEMTSELKAALRSGDPNVFTEKANAQKHFIPLVTAAFNKALKHETTLEEVFRIAGEVEDVKNSDEV